MTEIDATEWSVWPETDEADLYFVMGKIGNHTWPMAECDNQGEAEQIVSALIRVRELEKEIEENVGVIRLLRRQRDEAESTIKQVRIIADDYANRGWRDTFEKSCDVAQGMNIAGDAILDELKRKVLNNDQRQTL